MSDLFSRIAASHLGLLPQARPALRPALAPRAPAISGSPSELMEEVDGRKGPLRTLPTDVPNSVETGAAPNASSKAFATPLVGAAAAGRGLPQAASAQPKQTRPAAVKPPQRSDGGDSNAVADHVAGDAALADRNRVLASVSISPAPASASASFVPVGELETHRGKPAPPVRREVDNTHHAPWVSSSRMEALMAQQSNTRVPLAPVVHVQIDRLEVRAPAAPHRTAPPARSRPAASGTLSSYLRGVKP